MSEVRIFWLDAPHVGRIAVMPYPASSTFPALKREGVDVVVSLLEAGEARRVGLGDEAGLCRAAGIEFLSLPVRDHSVPDAVEPVTAMALTINKHLLAGRGVAVHCFAGLGRSPLLIAAALIERGMGALEACDLISAARGYGVPARVEQSDWLLDYERLRRGWA